MHSEATVIRLQDDKCPVCEEVLNAASSLDGVSQPKPDDVTVCAYCTSLLKYNKGMMLAILSEEEYKELPRELIDELELIQMYIRRQTGLH